MSLQLIRSVCVHAIYHLLPLLVCTAETVVLVDYEENSARNKNSIHFRKAFDNVRPEVNGLKGSNYIKVFIFKREGRHIGFQYITTAFCYGFCIYLFPKKPSGFLALLKILLKSPISILF